MFLLVSIPALIATASLKLNPRWTKALPREDPLIAEYLQIVEDPLRGSTVYVVVDGPAPEAAARRFVELARSLPHVRYIHGVDAEVLPYELMFLTRPQLEGLTRVAQRLDLGDLITDFSAPADSGSATAVPAGGVDDFRPYALPLLEALAAALEGRPAASPTEIVTAAFGARLGLRSVYDDALLLRVETDFSEQSIEDLPPFVEALHGIQEQILMTPPHARIRLTGYPVTAYDEMQRISSSGRILTVWSILLVIVLLRLFLGDLRSVFCSITVILVSLLWILGLIRVVFGEMNTVTMIMGMVIVGLGIDFCIHWLNHFRHGQERGYEGLPLHRFVLKKSASPLLAGAITTSGAFLCLLLLDVPSIREFAWLSAAGILLTALLALFGMPFLMSGSRPSSRPDSRITQGVVLMARSAMRRPRWVVGVFAILLLVGGWSLRHLAYEYNYARLQIGGLTSYRLKEEIIHRFGFSSDILIQRVEGLEAAEASKRQLLAHSEISHVESISDWLPPPGERAARAALIAALQDSLAHSVARRYEMEDLVRIRGDINRRHKLGTSTIPGAGVQRREFDRYTAAMERITAAINPGSLDILNDFNREIREAFGQQVALRAEVRDITFEDLPAQVKAAFRTAEPGVYLQFVFPAGNLWEKEPAEAMERVLSKVAPPPVGLSRIAAHLKRVLLGQGVQMIIAAILVVLVTLRVALKSWPMSILAMIPLVCGVVLTVATLSLLGIRINFYNLVGIPIILGIGIDDGVHLANAYRTQERHDPVAAVRETGAAIVLTSLTSMVGFGCLAFYRHPGMSTLGVVLFIGVGWCLVTTLFQLPVLLQWLAPAGAGFASERSAPSEAEFPVPPEGERRTSREEMTRTLEIPGPVLAHHATRASTSGAPYYLYDTSLIRQQCRQFAEIPYEPKSIHFATMANVNPEFLRVVRESGLSAFVNSLDHLREVLRAGFAAESIVFTASALSDETMSAARRLGVQVNLDSPSQLQRWFALFPEASAGIRCNIGSQVAPRDTRAGYFLGQRSRLGFTTGEIEAIAGDPRITALHLYVGTDIMDVDYFIDCYRVLWRYARLFPNLACLNFGGGFGVPEQGDAFFDVAEYGRQVSGLMREECRAMGREIRLALEPGRIIGGKAGYFFCKVTDVKLRGDHQFIGVDASSTQFPRPLLYPETVAHPVAILRDGLAQGGSAFISSVYGCSTYSRDFLARETPLPAARIGDWVVLGRAGSYCASARTEFLGFPAAEEIFL